MKYIMILTAALMAASATFSMAQVDIDVSVQVAPPELPIYIQPLCPGDGYLWTPGYWAYDGGYYWVPGVWVHPPDVDLLWTPPYWEYYGSGYRWHNGYWGEHVGFYGGIDYGYGYGGFGFFGGRWEGRSFRYNTAVMNVNTTLVRNTYVDRMAINHESANSRKSFNGEGGVAARPRPQEEAAQHERHVMPTSDQTTHHAEAAKNKNQFATFNHGHPATVTTTVIQGTHSTPREDPATHAEQQADKPHNTPDVVHTPREQPASDRKPAPTEQRQEEKAKPVQQQREVRRERAPAAPAHPNPTVQHVNSPRQPPRTQQKRTTPPKENREKKN